MEDEEIENKLWYLVYRKLEPILKQFQYNIEITKPLTSIYNIELDWCDKKVLRLVVFPTVIKIVPLIENREERFVADFHNVELVRKALKLMKKSTCNRYKNIIKYYEKIDKAEVKKQQIEKDFVCEE